MAQVRLPHFYLKQPHTIIFSVYNDLSLLSFSFIYRFYSFRYHGFVFEPFRITGIVRMGTFVIGIHKQRAGNDMIRRRTVTTENDVLNGLGMLFMKLLTNRAQIFADVRTYWSPEAVKKATGYELEGVAKQSGGFIHLINSGAACLDACGKATDENGNGVMKPWYDVTDKDIDNILDATTWNYADLGYFRGGGYSSRFVTEAEMPCTMIRLNLVKGLGPVLQIAEGWTVHLPDEVTDKLWKRTDYTWPCTWFAPRTTGEGAFKTAYDVMNNWGANHGHIGADLITLCSMLRIPVAMHNVPEKDIFRPAAWNAFGMDKEGQDFRACNAYGPMYRNIR